MIHAEGPQSVSAVTVIPSGEDEEEAPITRRMSRQIYGGVRADVAAGRWQEVSARYEVRIKRVEEWLAQRPRYGKVSEYVRMVMLDCDEMCGRLRALHAASCDPREGRWFRPGGAVLQLVARLYEWCDLLLDELDLLMREKNPVSILPTVRACAQFSVLYTRVYLEPSIRACLDVTQRTGVPNEEHDRVAWHIGQLRACLTWTNWRLGDSG